MNHRGLIVAVAGLAWIGCAALASAANLSYSTGFESSDGFALNGNISSTPATSSDWWRFDDGPTTTTPPVVDITSTNNGGSQGLHVGNQGTFDQGDPFSNTFVVSPVISQTGFNNVVANNTPLVHVTWDMRVDDAGNINQDSNYWGLDVLDGSGNTIVTVARFVPSAGSAVMIGTGSDSTFSTLGVGPDSGAWATYDLVMDYSARTWQLFVNGTNAGQPQDFVTTAIGNGVDVDFADVGRGLDAAFFDNFSATATPVPEPMAISFFGLIMGSMLARRRSDRSMD